MLFLEQFFGDLNEKKEKISVIEVNLKLIGQYNKFLQ